MIPTSQIIRSFRSVANFSNDGEVALFRHLANAIVQHSSGIFIDETHGNVAKVEYTSKINGTEKCEISDLLLVMRHASTGRYRATFWQTKKEKHPRWKVDITDANFDFEAQFNQWELLAQRPIISGISHFNPPSDLLANATSPSIGSFGVFFERNGEIEVNYSVAEMVSTTGITKHPRMAINGLLKGYYYAHQESIVRPDIESFLESINDFTIGSLLNPTSKSDQWLAGYINGKCSANSNQDFVDDRWEGPPPDRINVGPSQDGDGISVLMIDIDSDLTSRSSGRPDGRH